MAPDGKRVYAAAANGGVWRSDDAGATWQSTMDAFDLDPPVAGADSIACGAIAIDPNNPDRVYVGTGEPVAAVARGGVGVVRSDTGGLSVGGGPAWIQEPTYGYPLTKSNFYAIAVDPADGESAVAATDGGVYVRRKVSGQGPYQWQQQLVGPYGGPAATSVVVARDGQITTFYAALAGVGVFNSTDGGMTWVAVGTAPLGSTVKLAVFAKPRVLYALVDYLPPLGQAAQSQLWRYGDYAQTWVQVSNVPTNIFAPYGYDQGTYDAAIAVDPNDENMVYLAGILLLRCAIVHVPDNNGGGGFGVSASEDLTTRLHPDVHALAFTPPNWSNQLWVGCDGGVFRTDDARGVLRGLPTTFEPLNIGLPTLQFYSLAGHPTQDAVLFGGTQDNGVVRYNGDEAWSTVFGGDGFSVLVNWADPYQLLVTTSYQIGTTLIDTGDVSKSWEDATIADGDAALYIPGTRAGMILAATPYNPSAPNEANVVAFGGGWLWLSDRFGASGSWSPIPSNADADNLIPLGDKNARWGRITAIAFQSATRLFVATTYATGNNDTNYLNDVFRFELRLNGWHRSKLTTSAPLPLTGRISSLAIDWSDPAGESFFITFGSAPDAESPDARRVLRFDGSAWSDRSGSIAHHLANTGHNVILVDPVQPHPVFVGADLGVWRSADGGANWDPFPAQADSGLPDVTVFDLSLFQGHLGQPRLLRAATYGRGVYEIRLDGTDPDVELFVRDTVLDRGRYPTQDFVADPTRTGAETHHWDGPDIKLDVPDSMGQFQATPPINFFQFADELTDRSPAVPVFGFVGWSEQQVTNRVYVQAHNRGALPASETNVVLVITQVAALLPDLPDKYWDGIANPLAFNWGPDYQLVGVKMVGSIQVGSPRIAEFEITPNLLPSPADIFASPHFCVAAFLTSPDDPFNANQRNLDLLDRQLPKSAHKNMQFVYFAMRRSGHWHRQEQWMSLSLNGSAHNRDGRYDLTIDGRDYGGRLALLVPPDVHPKEGLQHSLVGLRPEYDAAVEAWAEEQKQRLSGHLDRETFHPLWSRRALEALREIDKQPLLTTFGPRTQASVRRLQLPTGGRADVFLRVEPPPGAKPGDSFSFSVYQGSSRSPTVVGGVTYRVHIVAAPDS